MRCTEASPEAVARMALEMVVVEAAPPHEGLAISHGLRGEEVVEAMKAILPVMVGNFERIFALACPGHSIRIEPCGANLEFTLRDEQEQLVEDCILAVDGSAPSLSVATEILGMVRGEPDLSDEEGSGGPIAVATTPRAFAEKVYEAYARAISFGELLDLYTFPYRVQFPLTPPDPPHP